MNNTTQVSIISNDDNIKEQLIAQLSELQYDGFEEKETELLAFIAESNFDSAALQAIVDEYRLSFTTSIIPEQNWNAVWESNFSPVVVEDFCAIRAEFHAPFTNIQHEIIITPKMSFGTGHHATTYMMISQMSNLDLKGKQVADFGTGTGVLAILAEKLGAAHVWAIDYDDWSIENSRENIGRNSCSKITIEQKDRFETSQQFDVILANINKNVILENVAGIIDGIKENGTILLSGLLQQDEEDIVSSFTQKGCKHVLTLERNKWISLLLICSIKNL